MKILHSLIAGIRPVFSVLARRVALSLVFLTAGLVPIRPCASQTCDDGLPALRTGTWTATGSLTNARANHTATLLAGIKVLVGGGDHAIGRPVPLAPDAVTFTDVSEA